MYSYNWLGKCLTNGTCPLPIVPMRELWTFKKDQNHNKRTTRKFIKHEPNKTKYKLMNAMKCVKLSPENLLFLVKHLYDANMAIIKQSIIPTMFNL